MTKKTTTNKSRLQFCSGRMLWLSILLLVPALAHAQPELRLEMSVAIERTAVVNNETVISYEAADKTSPGDKLAYRIAYHNVGDEPAASTSLTGVIPSQSSFLKTLELPKETAVRFSIDGGKSYHEPPIMIEVTNSEGKTEKRAADPASYTHIRFTLKTTIQPGATGSVGYLVEIK